MQSIFSSLIEEKRIIAIESIKIDSPKTKLGIEVLKSLELDSALIIVSELDNNDIDDEGAELIASSLENNTKLKRLDLQSNGITQRGIGAFLKLS